MGPLWLLLVTNEMTKHLAIQSSTPRVSVMLFFYRDAMEQTIRKRQLQRHYRYLFLLFPSGSMIFALLMLNMELSLSQRPFQEVTSGSSIPSSGPKGESRAQVLIDCPHSPLKSHRCHKTQERGA